MSNRSKAHFIQQQGFPEADPTACGRQFAALMFQPWLVGLPVAAGLITQSPALFLALSAVLVWNVLVPRWNPFDALYRALVSGPRGLPPLGPAPAPRRFAQGMAATFLLGIGLSLLAGNATLAWILEGFLVVALSALLAGRLCLGSYVYHRIKGNGVFANRTLPWARP
jgi:hypothetical protein